MSAPHYVDDSVTLHHGDCLAVLRVLPDASIDAVVTDPPYGISFMGREWDAPGRMTGQLATGDEMRGAFAYGGTHDRGHADHDPVRFQQWCTEWSRECLRVLKPGGHMLAFGGSRTWHRLASAVEDAGFEIRDSIAWLYGSGFPKSLDVSKAIDKLDAAEERDARARVFQEWLAPQLTAKRIDLITGTNMGHHLTTHPTQPSVATSAVFDLLRPHLAEVPDHIEELVAQRTVESKNFGSRPVTGHHQAGTAVGPSGFTSTGDGKPRRDIAHTDEAAEWAGWGTSLKPAFEPIVVGRKPLAGTVAANVIRHRTGGINVAGCRVPHVDAEDLAASLAKNPGREDTFTSDTYGADRPQQSVNVDGRFPTNVLLDETTAAALGSPARYFPTFHYEAKAPTSERPTVAGVAHPTVKPLDLMRWLVRLVTPPGGVVLEPFAGSGTTAEACVVEGFRCIAIEREADYLPLIVQRLTKPIQLDMFGGQ